MITNYHTHTRRCKHADNIGDEKFVQCAIENGYSILGFADHSPWPYESDTFAPGVRMELPEFPEYCCSIRSLQKKYEKEIHIYLGLECEYYPQYLPWLKQVKNQLDYLLLGNHWPVSDEYEREHFQRATNPEQIGYYFQTMIQGIETGLFDCVAHPDLVFTAYKKFDNSCIDGSYAFCRRVKNRNIPIEYNLYGLEKASKGGHPGMGYPCAEFWEIAKDVGCQALIGTDAHYLRHLANDHWRHKAEEYLAGLGIEQVKILHGLD